MTDPKSTNEDLPEEAAADEDEEEAEDEAEGEEEEESEEALEEKPLNVTNPEEARAAVSDLEVWGDPDAWLLVAKASSKSQGWMKSTKVMPIGTGVLVQVSTLQRGGGAANSQAVAEALCFVPDATIEEITDESDRVLARRIVSNAEAKQTIKHMTGIDLGVDYRAKKPRKTKAKKKPGRPAKKKPGRPKKKGRGRA